MKKILLLLLLLMSANMTQAREVTPPPVVSVEITDDAVIITAIGDGEVHLYVNDEEVENPYVIPRGEEDVTIFVYATAQEEGKDKGTSEIQPIVIEKVEGGEEPFPNPYDEGVWIVTLDYNGEERWQEMILDNGDFNTYIRLSSRLYGESDERPLVQTYFYIDGMRYGATSPNRNLSYVNVYDNPLIKSNNYFVLENGYRYLIGILMTENTEYFYLYGIKLPLYNEDDPNGYIIGDADRDGKVTIADVITIIDYLLSGDTSEGEISQISKANADCDGNGKVTIADVALLIDYLIKDNWY